ncbi:uncharacterized protein LOC121378807 [Gigantopelta aegis]|uniref:uncharacterized protein LOC121378807 n=1 Tax=Gigantopelta aegis TaxID=1735272 RepID=UPI001B889E2F|nr:uncharacterized protein LOC121378807 [Gigantopelta aegis]
MQSNVTITKQYVFMIERNIILNVFDCVNNATNEREVYYIQKGGCEGTIGFKKGQAMYTPPSNSADTSRNLTQPSPYQPILLSTREVTDAELEKLAGLLQTDWRKLINKLGVDEDHCDKILRAHMQKSLKEKVKLCLQYWKSSTQNATVGVLARGLEAALLKPLITAALRE